MVQAKDIDKSGGIRNKGKWTEVLLQNLSKLAACLGLVVVPASE
jgi:hypothetical protein